MSRQIPPEIREKPEKTLVSARPLRHHVNAVPDQKTEGGARMLMTNPLLIDRFDGALGSFVVGTCQTA
jgi:hypothetical protein